MCSAAEARSTGPVHGRKFTPAAIDATQASTRRSMPSLSYSGRIVGIVTRNVTAPEPSRCTTSASSAEPRTIFVGRVPTAARIRSTTGSSMPASVMTPKNRMANTNIAATGAVCWRPATT
jgi:hypothetical protein